MRIQIIIFAFIGLSANSLLSCSGTKTIFVQGRPTIAATGYVFNFTVDGDTLGIKQYELQDSVNGRWQTINTIKSTGPGNYKDTLPATENYYRLKSVRKIGKDSIIYYGGTIHVTFNNAVITNALNKSTAFTWTVANAVNADFFLIEKSTDNINYSMVLKASFKGNGNYSYRHTKPTKTYSYRISTVYHDNTKSKPVAFQ